MSAFEVYAMKGLLLWVPGLAVVDKTVNETKPGYKEYVETANAFVPWSPGIHCELAGQGRPGETE
jgi:steroid 5-alpha reductase family enzyme